MEVLYRFEDIQYAPSMDDWGNTTGSGPLMVKLREYRIVKKTPKGAWISTGLGDKIFVLLTARKRFACPTVEEAKESFKARKRVQIRRYTARAERARLAISIVEEGKECGAGCFM